MSPDMAEAVWQSQMDSYDRIIERIADENGVTLDRAMELYDITPEKYQALYDQDGCDA